MKIQSWVKTLGIQLDLQYPTYCDNSRNTWRARLDSNKSFGVFDEGTTSYNQADRCNPEGISKDPNMALNNLCEAIRGKVLVFEESKEKFDIPKNLTA